MIPLSDRRGSSRRATLMAQVLISSEREHAQHLQESTENFAKSCRFNFQTDEKLCESGLLSMPRSTPWQIGQARADVRSTSRWDQVNRMAVAGD